MNIWISKINLKKFENFDLSSAFDVLVETLIIVYSVLFETSQKLEIKETTKLWGKDKFRKN